MSLDLGAILRQGSDSDLGGFDPIASPLEVDEPLSDFERLFRPASPAVVVTAC